MQRQTAIRLTISMKRKQQGKINWTVTLVVSIMLLVTSIGIKTGNVAFAPGSDPDTEVVGASASGGASLWKIVSGTLVPVNSSWDFQIPSLGSTGDPCVMVDDTSGTLATTTCSGGGGSAAWGSITGTLSDQSDLQAALDAKISVGTTTINSITSLPNLAITESQVSDLGVYITALASDTSPVLSSDLDAQTFDLLNVGTTTLDALKARTTSGGVVFKNNSGSTVLSIGAGSSSSVNSTFSGPLNTGNLGVTGNITVSGTVDGVDIASRDHDAVTLTGAYDFLSLSGQEITLGQVDLGTDVTGTLLITNGGTGTSTATGARANLGLAIGSDVQAWDAQLDDLAALTPASSLIIGDGLGGWETVTPANFKTNNNILDTADIGVSVQAYDAELAAIAGLTSAADRGIYFTGSGSASVFTLTSAGRSILDDASTSAIRTTLGLGTAQSPQFTAVNVGNASDTTLARLSAGDLTVEGNLLYRAGGTDVPVTDGGTGASDAATARTNLGLAIGSDIQAYDAFLQDIATLTDPGADRVLFWDDSGSIIDWLTAGAGLTITGNTITVDLGTSIDISDETNLAGTANEITLTGDTLSLASALDLSSKTLEIPNGTATPGTCAVGQIFFDTDETAGQNLYGCTATNTWTLLGDGGGGGGDSISIDSVAVVDPDFQSGGDIDFVDTSNVVTANINADVVGWEEMASSTAIDEDTIWYLNTGQDGFVWDIADTATTGNNKGGFHIDNTDNTGHAFTLLSDMDVNADGPLVRWEASNTGFDKPVLEITNEGTAGSASGIRLNGPRPEIEFWETDQVAPAGAYELRVNGDLFEIGSRNAGGTGFEYPFQFYRLADGGDFNINTTGAYIQFEGVDTLSATTLGSAVVNSSLTGVGTLTSGSTGSGFTVDLDNSTLTATDVITHANIADSDQTDTKCLYLEDPTADDDLQSIWANKTANDFLLTEIWAESDQTVNFDLQIDDGTPADVNGTDISPAAGEAEDTSLSGDTTLAAGEELDLVITSVSGTPTWISICWTGNWVD